MRRSRVRPPHPAMVEVELEVEEDTSPSALSLVAATSPHAGVVHDELRQAGTTPGPDDPRSDDARFGEAPYDGVRTSEEVLHGPDARARREPWSRRRRVLVTGSVVVAVGAAGVAGVVEDRRAQERAEALAAIPGVVASFDEPVEVAWRASTALGATSAGDLLLRWQERAEGLELQAVDVATGTERWTAERVAGSGVDWCEGSAGDDDAPVVVCWRVSPSYTTLPDGAVMTHEGTLVALSAEDGSVVAEHPLDLPSSGYGVLDGDVVLGYRDGSTVRAVRLDPVTGAQTWAREVPLTARQVDGSYSAWLTVDDGLVVVHGATTAVLSPDGDVLGTWDAVDSDAAGFSEAQQGAQVDVTPTGFGVWPQALAGTGASTGTWYDRSGEVIAAVDGFLAEPEVTDGSAAHVLLTAPRTRFDLMATDLTTGETLWTVPLEGGEVLVRRDGVAVAADGRRVFAVEVVTGEERWSVPVPGVRPDLGSVTDGERVLVMAQHDGRWVLRAVALDGIPLWSVAVPASAAMPEVVPPDTPALWSIDGRVVTANGQVLVGLG
ncbi:PQQ-like beta-propeller repeat protein [Actinotalea ferrariae]|uniref:outer membrane protein assembly factor BamB family protein n=1 Tax=Actinotalea ferrariae TaxID=1386098 RepID=UPI001C8C6CB4|nr:PQQ-binding-like beta-propeller repeat protein [Actinotalea ferrariae]MBX9246152.1 PQQ-like beta-propeller repeat protein [Actinotalea ferrariae]